MQLAYRGDPNDWAKALAEDRAALLKAASGTINDVAQLMKSRSRAAVAAAGFSQRFQNALQTKVFPSQPSFDAAAWLFDKIPYAGIFEEGGTIPGSPLIWIAFSNASVPLGVGGRPIPPRLYVQRYGPLFSIPGPTPLLGARINGKLVPLYFGKSAVTIGKKFDTGAEVEKISADVPAIFEKNLKV